MIKPWTVRKPKPRSNPRRPTALRYIPTKRIVTEELMFFRFYILKKGYLRELLLLVGDDGDIRGRVGDAGEDISRGQLVVV